MFKVAGPFKETKREPLNATDFPKPDYSEYPIKVSIGNNYGREAIYPQCDRSKVFAQIAGTKTLTRETITLIKKLGYDVQVITSVQEL